MSGPLRALELAFEEVDSRKAEMYRRGMLPDYPTLVQHGPLRILISSSPSDGSLDEYAKLLRSYNVAHVVRACEPTYSADNLEALGFHVHEMPFADGEAPSDEVITRWLCLLDKVCDLSKLARKSDTSFSPISLVSEFDTSSSSESVANEPIDTIAVHCAAGLGRAPVLAAIALVEAGMSPFEAVGSIRASRRGAMNGRQMAFVESYTRRPPPSAVKPRQRSRPSFPSQEPGTQFLLRSPADEWEPVQVFGYIGRDPCAGDVSWTGRIFLFDIVSLCPKRSVGPSIRGGAPASSRTSDVF
ncbi:Protein-tyrosine-phosphatase [Gracilaria domingensis]|nr:Protein-tyrosine-phosphatase [Gracilaria domingensis]